MKMKDNNTPLVTVVCLTYNHEKFIKQALDGFIMQKTSFPFEVIVHDDASSDGTADIVREYEKKYQNIIKPIYQTENQLQNEEKSILRDIFAKIKSKYVALCEGDDYWIDPEKLQKQVDFLEKHKDCALCFHATKVIYENGEKLLKISPSKKQRLGKYILTLKDFLKTGNIIETSSVMYRWRFIDEDITKFLPLNINPCDYIIHLLHAQKGNIGYIDKEMSIYCKHSQSIWFNFDKEEHSLKYGISRMNFYKFLSEKFYNNSTEYTRNTELPIFIKLIFIFAKNKRYDLLDKLFEKFPTYLKMLDLSDYKEIYENYSLPNKIRNIKKQRLTYFVLFIVTATIALSLFGYLII
ncbi:MAG: glycosyltransferase [Endomicrobium sp.]|jgi:glycosyltransferase involved in cell wall biosynthesis|nr:glycosyltransferase [Endomicrobium sp.]